jgi:hypothetical protein
MVFLMGHCSQVSSFASRVARADTPPLGKMFEPKPTRSIAPACVRFLKIGNLGNGRLVFPGSETFSADSRQAGAIWRNASSLFSI